MGRCRWVRRLSLMKQKTAKNTGNDKITPQNFLA
jgi:hypothetical protein